MELSAHAPTQESSTTMKLPTTTNKPTAIQCPMIMATKHQSYKIHKSTTKEEWSPWRATREEYERHPRTVREAYGPESRRYRLVNKQGTGEFIERNVSRSDHKRINQIATKGKQWNEFYKAYQERNSEEWLEVVMCCNVWLSSRLK